LEILLPSTEGSYAASQHERGVEKLREFFGLAARQAPCLFMRNACLAFVGDGKGAKNVSQIRPFFRHGHRIVPASATLVRGGS